MCQTPRRYRLSTNGATRGNAETAESGDLPVPTMCRRVSHVRAVLRWYCIFSSGDIEQVECKSTIRSSHHLFAPRSAKPETTWGMTDNHQVIALCSVGSLGKYLCDELLADGRYTFIVISRQVSPRLKGLISSQILIDLRSSQTKGLSSSIVI